MYSKRQIEATSTLYFNHFTLVYLFCKILFMSVFLVSRYLSNFKCQKDFHQQTTGQQSLVNNQKVLEVHIYLCYFLINLKYFSSYWFLSTFPVNEQVGLTGHFLADISAILRPCYDWEKRFSIFPTPYKSEA